MKNLNDLLDNTFGSNTPKVKESVKKTQNNYRKQRGLYFQKSELQDLVISLNYAINSIKNKKDVLEKSENSTRYVHYKRWVLIRQKIKDKLKIEETI